MNEGPISIRELFYKEAGLNYAVKEHQHSAFQWYCVIYGTVDTVVDGTTYALNPEESILIPPGAVRAPHCRDQAPGYVNVVFENYRLNLAGLVKRVVPAPPELRPDLFSLVTELRRPGPNTTDLVEALLVRLLIGLNRTISEEEDNTLKAGEALNTASQKEIVDRVEAYMQRNLHQNLSRQDLGEVVHLSPTHLARIFHQTTGKTLTGRLREMRIQHAQRLLLDSTLSIGEIGFQVGYSSFSHFSKAFKDLTGVSPSEYRRHKGRTGRDK